jgi:myo-inositol-1(or 4)-monophosphatase
MKLEAVSKELISLCKVVGSYILSEQDKISSTDISTKGLHDYVTHVDKQSEIMLVEGLSSLLPGAGFLVEENTVENTNATHTWIIDPLDGTTNFIHGLPTFAISVALMKDHEIIMGVVYDVKAKECYYASKDSPALMNGREIKVSDKHGLAESLLATGFPYNDFDRQAEYLEMLGHLMQHSRGIRRFGSAAIDLAWVACGRFDGFWEYSLKPWDVAAGSFIVQRAGGTVTDFKGKGDFIFGGEILCGNPEVYAELAGVVERFMNRE